MNVRRGGGRGGREGLNGPPSTSKNFPYPFRKTCGFSGFPPTHERCLIFFLDSFSFQAFKLDKEDDDLLLFLKNATFQ